MNTDIRAVRSYCLFCEVHCPIVATVQAERVMSIEPDATHPFGGAICAKGRAAPEFHDHGDRVNFPMRRTRPKTDDDPGWERVGWDEALSVIAAKMLEARASSGPHAVAFVKGTIGGTGLIDAERWLSRLANYFGTPNIIGTTHLCQWPRDTGAAFYTFGTEPLPMPEVARSRCVVIWGSNPSANFLSLARDLAAAKARGIKLIVIDPRRIGLANKADAFLQVRPGTDGALALSLIHVLLNECRHDEIFVREWTNAPLLVRADTGNLLLDQDLTGAPVTTPRYVAVREDSHALVSYDPSRGSYEGGASGLALRGSRRVRLAHGAEVECRPVFECLTASVAAYPPSAASRITGVPAEQIILTARLLADNRPVSHYFHNGLVQHTNATQASRAIGVLYALLGDFDRSGGNVVAPGPRVNPVHARSVLPKDLDASRLGRHERPLGPPARPGVVTAYDLYSAILHEKPYPVRALIGLGANMLLANGDTLTGRSALERLEFFAMAELVHTPTSKFADILLPVTSFLETPALKLGWGYPLEAQAHIQSRPPIVKPLYERRSDVQIIFELACRLGLGEHFWGGNVEAAYDYILEPAGLTWDALRELPCGVRVPSEEPRYKKYAETDPKTGAPRGFNTPTRKVEIFAVPFAAHAAPPLPVYEEPALSPATRPDLADEFPLILTNAKRPQYLHSQHRGLPSLRKLAPNPIAEIHPETAARYNIADGDWIAVETPSGAARAQARVTDIIMPGVVCGNHGWWQACPELGLPGFDPFAADGANMNLLVLNDLRDPVSGSTPHRSTLCRVRKVNEERP
jgi:anaerobic selenocysteine-containing dehydrogenase